VWSLLEVNVGRFGKFGTSDTEKEKNRQCSILINMTSCAKASRNATFRSDTVSVNQDQDQINLWRIALIQSNL
jgi:hypothetical protein